MPSVLNVDIKDLASQESVTAKIGSMKPDEVATVLAQKAKTVAANGGSANAINPATATSALGLGKYNVSPAQLEDAGFLKPGTVERYADDPAQLASVLNSPSVWTGKDGVANAAGFLNNSSLQTSLVTDSMSKSFDGLKASGVLTGTEPASVVASLTSVSSEFGLDSAKQWLDGGVGGDLGTAMDLAARGAQLATDMVATKLPAMLGGAKDLLGGVGASVSSLFAGSTSLKTVTPPAVTQTVKREGVDNAVLSLIGSDKVPAPNFTGIVSPDKLQLPALSGPIDPAFLQSAGAGILGQATRSLGNVNVSTIASGFPSAASVATKATNSASSLLKSPTINNTVNSIRSTLT